MEDRIMTKQEVWEKMRRRFIKGVTDYGLIEDGDRILVGLSGGKDSLALLQLLAWRSRIYVPRFSVVAAHVSMTNIPYASDTDWLRSFCEGEGVPFLHVRTSFDPSTDTRKSPCFLCSWNRRKTLFETAKAEGCNKIALGHHMDDIIVTLLMNMTFQGAFSTMPPLLRMRKFDMTVIRPLCLVHEPDIRLWAELEGYRKQTAACPYERASHRSQVEDMFHALERMNPELRYNIWGSMTNVQEEMLPRKVK